MTSTNERSPLKAGDKVAVKVSGTSKELPRTVKSVDGYTVTFTEGGYADVLQVRRMPAEVAGTEDDFTCGCCGAETEAYGGIVHTHDDSTPDCEC